MTNAHLRTVDWSLRDIDDDKCQRQAGQDEPNEHYAFDRGAFPMCFGPDDTQMALVAEPGSAFWPMIRKIDQDGFLCTKYARIAAKFASHEDPPVSSSPPAGCKKWRESFTLRQMPI
jgi:hypothetical protein